MPMVVAKAQDLWERPSARSLDQEVRVEGKDGSGEGMME
jgi:hypothetical protein